MAEKKDQLFDKLQFDIVQERLKLITSAWILLGIAIGFTILFGISEIEKLWINSVSSKAAIYGIELQHKIEQKLPSQLENTKCKDDLVCSFKDRLAIWTGSGFLLKKPQQSSIEIDQLRLKYNNSKTDNKEWKVINDNLSHYQYNGYHFVRININQSEESRYNNWVIGFEDKTIGAERKLLLKQIWFPGFIIFLVGTSILTVCLLLVPLRVAEKHDKKKKRIGLMVFIPIAIAQIVLCTQTCIVYRNLYKKTSNEKIIIIHDIINDIDKIGSLNSFDGINEDKLGYLINRLRPYSPELGSVIIFDKNLQPKVVMENDTIFLKSLESIESDSNFLSTTLQASSGKRKIYPLGSEEFSLGYFVATKSDTVFWKKFKSVALDYLTGFLISLLFLVEMLILISQLVKERKRKSKTPKTHYSLIRPAAFLFLFGIDISISFLPLHMENLYKPFFWSFKRSNYGFTYFR